MYNQVRFAPAQESYNPAEELVLIVDKDNQAIGSCTRKEMREKTLTHRATFVFVVNPEGKLYVQKRTTTKDVFPGFYDVCTGGVVAANDPSILDSARRELQEEIGINPENIEFCFYHLYQDAGTSIWCACFLTYWEGELILQPEEVQWIELMSIDEIFTRSQTENFCPDALVLLRMLVDQGRLR